MDNLCTNWHEAYRQPSGIVVVTVSNKLLDRVSVRLPRELSLAEGDRQIFMF